MAQLSWSVLRQRQVLSAGPYYWRVRTIDLGEEVSAYVVANDGQMAFIVNQPPEVVITAPLPESIHESVAVITGTSQDADGPVVSVDLTLLAEQSGKYFDGTSFAADTPQWLTTLSVSSFSRWVFDTATVFEDGSRYTVQARVVDTLGQEALADPLTFLLSAADACLPPRVCLSLKLESGAGQSDVVGSVLTLPLVVRVVDSFGTPASGVRVYWEVLSGGGSVDAAETVSDSDGRAWTLATLGMDSGIDSDLYSAGLLGLPASVRYFSATAYEQAPEGSHRLGDVG